MKILNIPNEEYIYEFMVVKFLMNDKNGEAIYGFRRKQFMAFVEILKMVFLPIDMLLKLAEKLYIE